MREARIGVYFGKFSGMFGKHQTQDSINKAIITRKNSNNKSKSKYYGLSYREKKDFWEAKITLNGKSIYIGGSVEEEIAARKYDKYIIKNSLSRPLNFPNEYEGKQNE